MMNKDSKVYVAGHNGLVGSSILKALQKSGFTNLIVKSRKELDLTNQKQVANFFDTEMPEYVFLAAAKVGGIKANDELRADFIYENLAIQNNVIYQSFKSKVKKLLFLGSSCIYPRETQLPIFENQLLTGPLEYTNEPYAIAKIAGIKLCESFNLQYGTNFISAMPTNLYGPNDNFDLEHSHVIPAIIRKMILAKYYYEGNIDAIKKNVKINAEEDAIQYLESNGISKESLKLWGSGKPKREFLWSEDLSDACIFIMNNIDFSDLYNQGDIEVRNAHINIGTGKETSINELALLIKDMVGYKGSIEFDTTKPDGTMRKLLDVTKLQELGWTFETELERGLNELIKLYKNHN